MPKPYFFNTIRQIALHGGVSPIMGLLNYFSWQLMRLRNRYPIELRLSKSRIIIDHPTGVAALVKIFGLYDYNNMGLIQMLLTTYPDLVFVDIGANIGTYTLVAAETGAIVWAFEPHPTTFAALRKNVALNCYEKVNCYNFAVSDHAGVIGFSDFSESALNRVDMNGEIFVQSTTLDRICEERSLQKCIVKIDVEGSDMQVLQGFEKNFNKTYAFFVESDYALEIQKWMTQREYRGPFYFQKKQNFFTNYPQKRKEDGIFLSEAMIVKLSKHKFRFSTQK